MYKKRMTREELLVFGDVSVWPKVDISSLKAKKREEYLRRESAVFDYLAGKNINKISETYKLTPQFVYKMARKCIETHPDGRIWGTRAIVPHIRQRDYSRRAPVKKHESHSGYSGEMTRFFEKYPDIKETIEGYFFKKNHDNIVHESRITYKSTHLRFLEACRAKKIKACEYPFNTKYRGKRALTSFLKKMTLENYKDSVKARFGTDASRRMRLGGSAEALNPATRPYMRVEFDGHRLDIAFTMLIPSPFGGYTEVPVTRAWLLVIRDTCTGVILGHHLSFGREYNRFDVMECIKKSIMPWKKRELSIPGLKYTGGYPSEVFPELQWAIFQEFLYDNAKANLSDEVTRILVDVTGCSVNAGPVNNPERRALVESFFRIFEENGFHRLPSTLGNGPDDPRRQDPEEQAMKYKIKAEHIEELAEVLIARLNGTPGTRNGHDSPLERLEYFLNSGAFIPKLDENKRRRLSMFNLRFERTVRGNIEEGRRPYIEIEGARYTNDILSSSPELISNKITVYIDPKNAQLGEAYFEDGTELGILLAKGFWGRTPHTLEMRREINRARINQLIHYTENDDPIHVYIDYLSKEAPKNKKIRSKLAKFQKSLKTDSFASVPKRTIAVPEEKEPDQKDFDLSVFNKKAINL